MMSERKSTNFNDVLVVLIQATAIVLLVWLLVR